MHRKGWWLALLVGLCAAAQAPAQSAVNPFIPSFSSSAVNPQLSTQAPSLNPFASTQTAPTTTAQPTFGQSILQSMPTMKSFLPAFTLPMFGQGAISSPPTVLDPFPNDQYMKDFGFRRGRIITLPK